MTIDEKIVLNNYELGLEECNPKWYSHLDDEARREAKRLKRDSVMDIINKHFDDTDDYYQNTS